MKKFRSGLEKFCHAIRYISMAVLMFAVIVTVIDVILHLFTSYRVLGNMELVELGMIIMMYLCFGVTQLENGHVRVDLFVNKLPPKGRCALNGILQLVCAFFCLLLTIQSFKQVGTNYSVGKASQILHLPYWPFSLVMGVGFAVYTLTIILTALEYFQELPNAKPIERQE